VSERAVERSWRQYVVKDYRSARAMPDERMRALFLKRDA
jgi:hypothetical protein